MSAVSKYAQIYKMGSVIDEFRVKRTKFQTVISFKGFEVPAVPMKFTLPYLSLSHNPNIVRSPCIALRSGARKFIFYLECDETFACVGKKKYKLYMTISNVGDEEENEGGDMNREPKYVEMLALTECPCLLPTDVCCGNGQEATLLEMFPKTPVKIFTHVHNCFVQEIPGIICVKFTLIDTSHATMLPLKILKVKAKRSCLLAMEPILPDLDRILFDTKITTKEGDHLFVHTSILKIRSPMMHSLVELDNVPSCSNAGPPIKYVLRDHETSTFVMKVILHFLNTGALQEDWGKDMNGVITSARRYQLEELLPILEQVLIDSCTAQNVATFYHLSRNHDFKHAFEVIKKTHEHVNEPRKLLGGAEALECQTQSSMIMTSATATAIMHF